MLITDTTHPQRHFWCRRCSRDHPGVDCEGRQVECRHCRKTGHRAFECYSNPESRAYKGNPRAQTTGAGPSRGGHTGHTSTGPSRGGHTGHTSTGPRGQQGKETAQERMTLNSAGTSGAGTSTQRGKGKPTTLLTDQA